MTLLNASSLLHEVDYDGVWERVLSSGWGSGQAHLHALYPMPGDPGFENDEQFVRQPIFPGHDGSIVHAGDRVWPLPLTWFRELETRTKAHTQIEFDVAGLLSKKRGIAATTISALTVAWQKAIYLETFRARRPLAIATIRQRSVIYRTFIKTAITSGKPLSQLDYSDLAEAVGSLNRVSRSGVPAVYETLRNWKAKSPGNFPFFDLPPSIEAITTSGVVSGFNPAHVREESEAEENKTWQPLPDAFVATAGGIALDLVEKVRPVLLECLTDLIELRGTAGWMPTTIAERRILRPYNWPKGYEVETFAQLRKRCRQAQTATIFLLSLLLGCRSSEVLGLPRRSVKRVESEGQISYLLDGTTFKLSQNFAGDSRDWPIHEALFTALELQDHYLELTEGSDFRYMWKKHNELFASKAWLRDVDSQLQDFIEEFNLKSLLEGKRCHHHRFRKTTARLIVIALYGGPLILRRLFGHQHLAMTLRYILSNTSIIDELREIAEQEQSALAKNYVERSSEVLGHGGVTFRTALTSAAEMLDLTVPEGKREQASYTAAELVTFLGEGPDGLTVKQILPGLLACFKPRDAAGMCCSAKELPNVAKCSAECKWQMMLPEFEEQAARNVEDALEHLAGDPGNPLKVAHYAEVVTYWIGRFPLLTTRFSGHPAYTQAMAPG